MPARDYYLPQRQLVSQADSARIAPANVPRSQFQGRWTRKTAFDAGYLVPILVDELLPGDHMRYDVQAYVRMATPVFPIFDNQRIDTFFFFVPARLLWDKWTRFMGEQSDPSLSIDLTIPLQDGQTDGSTVGSLQDHMGIPVTGQIAAGQLLYYNALPFRAYNQIWNAWFRDENIQSSVRKDTDDGPDAYSNYVLLKRNKSADYFTTALPWPQKFTAPLVPLGGTAPVIGIGVNGAVTPAGASPNVYETDGNIRSYAHYTAAWTANQVYVENQGAGDPTPAIYADLASATGVAVETFRQAFLVQQLLERDARGGTRYTELIRSHFGVINPDFRLQRPEYIGGGQTPLIITPVAQTAPDAGTVVGSLGAAGTAAGRHSASYAATEHGYVIGLINVRSELSYQQGLHKLWTRRTRYDFYWPALAGLGEQAVLRQEIYATGTVASDTTIFGYQERWHEYRTKYSEVTGIMRSTASGTLDAWHLAQVFATAPVLNSTFLQDSPPMDRVLAAGALAANQQYLADIEFRRTATRPIPTYGTPATLGRF